MWLPRWLLNESSRRKGDCFLRSERPESPRFGTYFIVRCCEYRSAVIGPLGFTPAGPFLFLIQASAHRSCRQCASPVRLLSRRNAPSGNWGSLAHANASIRPATVRVGLRKVLALLKGCFFVHSDYQNDTSLIVFFTIVLHGLMELSKTSTDS